MLSRLHEDSPRFTMLAVFLSISTLPVLGAHALDDRLFNGVNVWNKPLKFQFSLIAYLITLAWFSKFAPQASRRLPLWVAHERSISWAIVLELVWICGAAATGVASHFNPHPVMAVIYGLMGLAAILFVFSHGIGASVCMLCGAAFVGVGSLAMLRQLRSNGRDLRQRLAQWNQQETTAG